MNKDEIHREKDLPPPLPEYLSRDLAKVGSDAGSEELSEHRTGLSEHRTDLSEHRTDLSERRTQLSDANSHMANERTNLSYIRMAVTLMSFGVTINRFSVYLLQSDHAPKTHGLLRNSENAGLGMVLLGMLLVVWAMFRYRKVHRELEEGKFTSPVIALTVIAMGILLLGAISTVWLILG